MHQSSTYHSRSLRASSCALRSRLCGLGVRWPVPSRRLRSGLRCSGSQNEQQHTTPVPLRLLLGIAYTSAQLAGFLDSAQAASLLAGSPSARVLVFDRERVEQLLADEFQERLRDLSDEDLVQLLDQLLRSKQASAPELFTQAISSRQAKQQQQQQQQPWSGWTAPPLPSLPSLRLPELPTFPGGLLEGVRGGLVTQSRDVGPVAIAPAKQEQQQQEQQPAGEGDQQQGHSGGSGFFAAAWKSLQQQSLQQQSLQQQSLQQQPDETSAAAITPQATASEAAASSAPAAPAKALDSSPTGSNSSSSAQNDSGRSIVGQLLGLSGGTLEAPAVEATTAAPAPQTAPPPPAATPTDAALEGRERQQEEPEARRLEDGRGKQPLVRDLDGEEDLEAPEDLDDSDLTSRLLFGSSTTESSAKEAASQQQREERPPLEEEERPLLQRLLPSFDAGSLLAPVTSAVESAGEAAEDLRLRVQAAAEDAGSELAVPLALALAAGGTVYGIGYLLLPLAGGSLTAGSKLQALLQGDGGGGADGPEAAGAGSSDAEASGSGKAADGAATSVAAVAAAEEGGRVADAVAAGAAPAGTDARDAGEPAPRGRNPRHDRRRLLDNADDADAAAVAAAAAMAAAAARRAAGGAAGDAGGAGPRGVLPGDPAGVLWRRSDGASALPAPRAAAATDAPSSAAGGVLWQRRDEPQAPPRGTAPSGPLPPPAAAAASGGRVLWERAAASRAPALNAPSPSVTSGEAASERPGPGRRRQAGRDALYNADDEDGVGTSYQPPLWQRGQQGGTPTWQQYQQQPSQLWGGRQEPAQPQWGREEDPGAQARTQWLDEQARATRNASRGPQVAADALRRAWLQRLWAAEQDGGSGGSSDPWGTSPVAAAPSLQQLARLGLADPSGHLLVAGGSGGSGGSGAGVSGASQSPWDAPVSPPAQGSQRSEGAPTRSGDHAGSSTGSSAGGAAGGRAGAGAGRAAAVGAMSVQRPEVADMVTRFKQLMDNLQSLDGDGGDV